MSDQAFRLFAAVQLPGAIKSRLNQFSAQKKELLPFKTWTHQDDLHITLFFLGDTGEDRVASVRSALTQAITGLTPFLLRVASIDSFGPPRSPSVLWAGIEGDMESLTKLQLNVQDALVTIGYTADTRPYRPHITLARRFAGPQTWDAGAIDSNGFLQSAALNEWLCEGITLYRSHLGRKPMYEVMDTFPFS